MSADLQQQPEAPQQAEPPQQQVEQPGADSQANAQPEPNNPADAPPPDGEEGDKKARRHLSSIQKRIDELTRERHDERRAREAAEARTAELEAQFRAAQGQAAEPKIEQFEKYDEYLRAYAKWEANQTVDAKLEEFRRNNLQSFERRQQQERAAQAAQQFDRALDAVGAEGKKVYADFDAVVANGPRLGPVVGQLVLATERPHDISYYLAKNHEHAMAIAAMPPVLAMREIGKLEAQFVNKRVTSAPPPPKTVGQSGKASTSLSDELSSKEWYRRRAQLNKQG